MKFSVIVPVYNRPDEIDEFLDSLTKQTQGDFEIIIVEDGSKTDCKAEVEKYSSQLNIKYFFKENGGPASARNYGFEQISGEYCIFFDSDIIVPPNYFKIIEKEGNKIEKIHVEMLEQGEEDDNE